MTAGADGRVAAPGPAELTERIVALPEVTYMIADEASGAPEIAWGDRFFFIGSERQRPFATIVGRDVPGFDEDSRLDRPGVFRLNMDIGREEFQRRFGCTPAEFPDHRARFDFAQLDEIVPHPAYGTHGWASILTPDRRLPEVDELLAYAHRRAVNRYERARNRRRSPTTAPPDA